MVGPLRRRATQRLPQRPSEGRASGKTRAETLLEAQLAGNLGRSDLSRAFFRDHVECPG